MKTAKQIIQFIPLTSFQSDILKLNTRIFRVKYAREINYLNMPIMTKVEVMLHEQSRKAK